MSKPTDDLGVAGWAQLSDEDVVSLFLTAFDSDVKSVQIIDERFKGPIVVLLKGGASIEGTLVHYTGHSVNIREEDGTVTHLFKSHIQAIRRPKQKP
jgi:hypothetical protein